MYIRSSSRISAEKRVLAWIRKRIHPYCWGRSDRFKEGFSQTSRRQILGFFTCLRYDLPRRFLPTINNPDFMGHFTGQHILYGQANGQVKVPETLINIDIDCHTKGSYEGAVECVEWLRNHGFPGLFSCRSTNGRGGHAYPVIRKVDYGDVALDSAITKLERWLQYQHHLQGWDIENIEVKGRPPIFRWGVQKYELVDIRMGTLAKIPVEAMDRPEELMATTCVSIPWLNRLALEVPKDWKRNSINCTTYSLPLRNDEFGEINAEDLRLWHPDTGSHVWCPWLERMAKTGLVDDDSMGAVTFELAKWLLWVELSDRDDRQELATELLQAYVLEKHNGHVSRMNEGRVAEVLSHVKRIVASAGEISPDSEELFERIRQNRSDGKYGRLIKIVPLLSETGATFGLEDERYNCTTYYSLPIREDLLPAIIEDRLLSYAKRHRMRRSQGEYPFIRFARTFLNVLWDRKGSARLSTALLTTLVTNVHQQNDFKVALRELDLLRDWTGTYRAKSVSCLYRLTDEAMDLFQPTIVGLSNARAG
jgi:hypothetical protein